MGYNYKLEQMELENERYDAMIQNDIDYAKHYEGFVPPEEPAPVEYGPYNDEGFLQEQRTGLFPTITYILGDGIHEARVHATLQDPAMSAVLVVVQASSMEKLRAAWNKMV